MSQAALALPGAGLEQAEAIPGGAGTDPAVREAQRLAELAGEFCLFGLDIAIDLGQVDEPADQAYRADDETAPKPANDAAPGFVFPNLEARGVHLSPALPVRAMQMLDWLVVLVAAELAARWGSGVGLADLALGAAAAVFAAAGALKAGLWITDAYRVSPSRMRAERSIGGLAIGAIAGLGIAAAFAPDARSAAALSATLPFAAMALAGMHAAIAVWTRAAHRAGVFSETIVLVGATEAAERVAQRVGKSGEARVVAIVDDRLQRAPRLVGAVPVGGSVEDLLAWEGLPHVDRIVITVTQKAESRVRDIIQRLRIIPNRVDLLMDVDTFNVRGGGQPALLALRSPASPAVRTITPAR